MNNQFKVYLGDSVYVKDLSRTDKDYFGDAIELCLDNGKGEYHHIVMGQEVVKQLLKFLKKNNIGGL